MKSAAILIACALPLAACNKGPQVNEKNASVAEVAKKVREAGGEESLIRAGLWQSKVTIEKFEMPGMPPEMTQRMKTMMAQNQEHGSQNCLTPGGREAAEGGFLRRKEQYVPLRPFHHGRRQDRRRDALRRQPRRKPGHADGRDLFTGQLSSANLDEHGGRQIIRRRDGDDHAHRSAAGRRMPRQAGLRKGRRE